MDSLRWWARDGEVVRQAIELGEIAHIRNSCPARPRVRRFRRTRRAVAAAETGAAPSTDPGSCRTSHGARGFTLQTLEDYLQRLLEPRIVLTSVAAPHRPLLGPIGTATNSHFEAAVAELVNAGLTSSATASRRRRLLACRPGRSQWPGQASGRAGPAP